MTMSVGLETGTVLIRRIIVQARHCCIREDLVTIKIRDLLIIILNLITFYTYIMIYKKSIVNSTFAQK